MRVLCTPEQWISHTSLDIQYNFLMVIQGLIYGDFLSKDFIVIRISQDNIQASGFTSFNTEILQVNP